MNMERLPAERHGHRYERMQPEPAAEGDASASSSSSPSAPARRPEVLAASASFRLSEATRVFEELPRATIFSVSRPDAGDITPMLLSYTIEINYKQVRGSSCVPPLLRFTIPNISYLPSVMPDSARVPGKSCEFDVLRCC
uniref:Uncharacterized protein n=1 Tax=Aegilops tauschii subsp. strangulata TaxID=200361 RepID=A0A452YY01_AEGTS